MGTCRKSLPCTDGNLVDEMARLRPKGYAVASPDWGGTIRRGEARAGRDQDVCDGGAIFFSCSRP